MNSPAPSPLSAPESAKLAALLHVLIAFCDHSPGIMGLALWRHHGDAAYDVDELRADLDMYAWALRGGT
jgi:hypothetical protein